jgi:beta-lactamase regulating signal transducer with metallopeptidase domain
MEALLQFGLANAASAALLAIVVAAVTRFWRNPYLAHVLWAIVLLRLVAPPMIQIPFRTPEWFARQPAAVQPPTLPEFVKLEPATVSPATHADSATASLPVAVPDGDLIGASHDPPAPLTVPPGRVAPETEFPTPLIPQPSFARSLQLFDALAGVWIAGTVLYVAITVVRVRRFARALRRSQCPAAGWLEQEIGDIAQSIGLRRVPRLMVVDGPLPPMVWSGWRPMLLVPQRIVESIDPSQRRLLLLHELLHIRRGDHLIRWFAVAVLALYWWNPFAWWAVRRLQNAEEECCDAAVLSFHPHDSEIYGEALLAVSEFVSCGSLPTTAVSIGVERKNHLKRRMTMILKGSQWPGLSRSQCAAVIGCGAVLIGVSLTTAAAQVEPLTGPKPAPKADSDKAKFPPHQQAELIPAAEKPAAPGKTGLALYDAKPLTISPGDDELHKLLKQKYNAALAKMTYYLSTFQTGNASLGDLSAAAKSVLDAELALDEKPPRDLQALERYLEFMKYLEKMAESKLSVGGAGGENPVLEVAQMREARLGAEIKLQDRRVAAARRPPASAAEALPGARQPTQGSSQAERLPAMLTAKPLEPAAGDHELVKLFKERHNAALKSLQGQYERAQIDAAMPMVTITLAAAGRTLLDAELALSSKDNVPLYERYLELTKFFEDRAAGLFKAKIVGQADFDAAREARLDAEIKLLQAKFVTAPSLRRAGAFIQSLEVRVRIAEGEVNAARAAVDQTQAELKRVLTELKYRQAQLDRVQSARKQDASSISDSSLEEAIRARDDAAAGVDAAKAAIRAAQAQVEIKGAQLEQVHLELKRAASEGK